MNPLVGRIANAVLYEGYILYPYRPALKNRQRFTFGGLLPEPYCRQQTGSDSWQSQTECLIHGDPAAETNLIVRFLHLTERIVGEINSPRPQWRAGSEPLYRPVDCLRTERGLIHSWQEAEEREIRLSNLRLCDLMATPREYEFQFPAQRRTEPIAAADGQIAGIIDRRQESLQGMLRCSAANVEDRLFRLTLQVFNRTGWGGAVDSTREQAVARSMAATHAVLEVRGGDFVSLYDPPELWREAASRCKNVGVWPVLVGDDGQTDCMLSSPIILYDYPQVAPESPGDLFDATEIDEILTLRIMTLTDDEKQAAAAVDQRARALLERTSRLSPYDLARMHGTNRPLRGVREAADE